MAEGGMLTGDGYQSSDPCPHNRPSMDVCEQCSGFVEHPGNDVKDNGSAESEDERRLNQHGAEETGPEGAYAEGGRIGDDYQTSAHEMDMVGRIMAQRQRSYSKGGRVANSGMGDLDDMADGQPNNFDDLSLRDDLESSNSGANDGDDLGNAREDKDRRDIVARIMASRAKRGRMPSPK